MYAKKLGINKANEPRQQTTATIAKPFFLLKRLCVFLTINNRS
jgi:hypothetical protein